MAFRFFNTFFCGNHEFRICKALSACPTASAHDPATIPHCSYHCADPDHGHCTVQKCRENSHCPEAYDCLKHCQMPGHGHCTLHCTRDEKFPGSLYCEEHLL